MPRGQYPRRTKQAAADEAPPVFVSEAPVPEAVAAPRSDDPLQANRRVEDMGEVELRTYALQIGIGRSDAANLPVPRLRENCLLRLYEVIEDL